MAFLKFNKSELVNLSYSLKREIVCSNKTGSYCNTSIVTCNTRRYHGLLAVPVTVFGGGLHLMLSSVDESIVVEGKQFNLGIHCYGDIYDPRGHKYIVDFSADPIPEITYKIGNLIFTKSILLTPDKDQVLIKYTLKSSHAGIKLSLKPFLAFRDIHNLTHQNQYANTEYEEVDGGVTFKLYEGYPILSLQTNKATAVFESAPCWYNDITYSDEKRRGFDYKEDLFVPGNFIIDLQPGESVIFSGATSVIAPRGLTRRFNQCLGKAEEISSLHQQLEHCAYLLRIHKNGRKQISAGLTWLYKGLLRETLYALPGLTLYANGDTEEFEEILDTLIADEKERLFHRTTQVEAPLYLACVLQQYIDFGADPRKVWRKYGETMRGIIESYKPGVRKEVAMQPNGLLWAQLDGWALSWMNAYVNGRPVTERAGYQVETNALWYNAICFALEMEMKYVSVRSKFIQDWGKVSILINENFQPTFWNEKAGYLADYVDNNGQNLDVRPNQLLAIWVQYTPIDDEVASSVLAVVTRELETARGIRTLSPRDVKYKGVYEGSQTERDLAYHQGCTRPFLLYHYVDLNFRFRGSSYAKKAEWLTEGFFADLSKHGVGAFSELYDGDPPHEPHGAISSALSTAALLGVDYLIKKYKEE